MKIILDLDGIGKIGVTKDSYVVFQNWAPGEEGAKPEHPKYFSSLKNALLELKQYNLGKYLAQKETARSFKELLERLEGFEMEWKKFLEEKVGRIEEQV
jgi:hypothetical protein